MLYNLDLLRAVAVLCVLGAHSYSSFTKTDVEGAWLVGQLGVLMFFVHTSLVLMMSLDRSPNIKEFYTKRAFRIYPLAVVCVLFAVWFGEQQYPTKIILSNLTLTQNLTYAPSIVVGLWSLPIEVQMYLALPLLHLAFRKRHPWLPLLGWLLTIPIAVIQSHVSIRLNVLSYAPCFLGGVLAWRLSQRYTPKIRAALWPLTVGATALIWLTATRATEMPQRWLFCLALGLTIPWCKDLPHNVIARGANVIARYSYGVYLSHGFVLTHTAHLPPLERVAVCCVLLTIVPVLLYHLVEAPMIKLGKQVSTYSAGTRASWFPGKPSRSTLSS